MKKRLFSVLLCLCLMICGAACRSNSDVSSDENSEWSSDSQASADSGENVTADSSTDTVSSKNNTTSSGKGTNSSENNTTSSGKGTTSSKNNTTSSGKGTTSSKNNPSSSKPDPSSSESTPSNTSSETETKVPEWKSNPQNYKLVAFTFDDAPNTKNPDDKKATDVKIVNAFKKYEGAGTLFVAGNYVRKNGYKLLQYAVNCGFELGNHTYNHYNYEETTKKYTNCEPDTYYNEEIKSLNDLIYNNVKTADGKAQYTMRFARSSNLVIRDPIMQAGEKYNMPLIGRQTGNGEFENGVSESTYTKNVINNVSDGSIVLMHIWSNKSANTIDDVLSELYNDGYRFCTLSELFEYKLGVTDLSKINVVASCKSVPTSGGIGHISEVVLE